MQSILIADDNKQIRNILTGYAEKEGYHVVTAWDGEEAVQQFQRGKFDIVLLDVMMPKKDGFQVCKEIREHSNVPIIIITARSEDYERIMGLDIGADDYILKPFSPGEVMARIRAILRRMDRKVENGGAQQLRCGNLLISLDHGLVSIGDYNIDLTKKELEILWLLANNKSKVFTRNNLLDSIWGYDYFGDNRTVDSHIKRLRAKMDKFDHPEWQISTVWGRGYQFEVNSDET